MQRRTSDVAHNVVGEFDVERHAAKARTPHELAWRLAVCVLLLEARAASRAIAGGSSSGSLASGGQ